MHKVHAKVKTSTDQEEVAHKFKKYDINIIPVVDSLIQWLGQYFT